MRLVLDGNPEIGEHVESKKGNLIRLRDLFGSNAGANLKLILKKKPAFSTRYEMSSNISTMNCTLYAATLVFGDTAPDLRIRVKIDLDPDL